MPSPASLCFLGLGTSFHSLRMMLNLFYIPATLRQLLSGVCIAAHTLLLKQNLVGQDGPFIHILLGLHSAGLLLFAPYGVCHSLAWVCHPVFYYGNFVPWSWGRGQPWLCLTARIVKSTASVHPDRACEAGIHFFHQQMVRGDLLGSKLASRGTAKSIIQFGASRRAKLGGEQQRAGLKIYFSPQSYAISS